MGEHWVWARWQTANARAVTTTRYGGFSQHAYAGLNLAAHVGDEYQAVVRNRQRLCQVIGLPHIQWLNQVHGSYCLQADMTTTALAPEADAAWTTQPGLALAVLTADCLPVVFCRRDGGAVGVAHAGWRGLVSGVLASVLRALPGEPAEYLAWIGPGIGVDVYQVGDEVAEAVRGMRNTGARADRYLHVSRDRPGKYQLDLAGLAGQQLGYLGVAEVGGERICSFSDQRFYSYRREGSTGRMATVVWLPDSLR